MDRHYYADHSLTIARHPSETDERMMVRVAAFALFAQERLEFCKGLSDVDEPDLWAKDLTGAIDTWIEVGQPDERRIAKASGRANHVVVIAYGGRTSEIWWQGVRNKVERLRNVTVWTLGEDVAASLGSLAERTMRLQCTVQDGEACTPDSSPPGSAARSGCRRTARRPPAHSYRRWCSPNTC